MEPYNGWTNYPTWAVYSWLSSDEATNGAMEAIAHSATTVYRAADEMRNVVEAGNPLAEGASMYVDMLNFAIGLVNWDEIATAYWQSTHDAQEQ